MDVYVIPDTQVRPRSSYQFLKSIALHIAQVKPDYIVMLGDWHDMPSCSYYDKGKKSHEVYNFIDDIEIGNKATDLFFDTLDKAWPGNRKKCKRVKLLGNHEGRIDRAFDYGDSNLREIILRFPIDHSRWDKVVPFLKEFVLSECYFSHYFPNDNTGKPVTSARMLLHKKHRSCIAGHQQGFDYAEQLAGKKRTLHAVIAGSCYTHDEEYKGPNNHHFRGTLILRDLHKGMFDIERYSLKQLMKRFK